MMWISSAETRLNTHFEIAPDLDTVKKQKRELEVHFIRALLTGWFFQRLCCSFFFLEEDIPKNLFTKIEISKGSAGKHSTGIKMT